MTSKIQPRKIAGSLLVSALLGSSAVAAPQTGPVDQAQAVLESIHLLSESREEVAAKLHVIQELLKRAKLDPKMRPGTDTEWLR